MAYVKRRRCDWCGRPLPAGRHLRICEACRRASLKAFMATIEPEEAIRQKTRKIQKERTNGKSPLMLASVNTANINWITYSQKGHQV